VPDAQSPRDRPRSIDLTGTVVVELGTRAPTKAGDHLALSKLVARLVDVDDASVSLTQQCQHCGATDHGALRIHLAGGTKGGPTLHVSLARSGDRLALAVTAAGPVGIDLESVQAVSRAPLTEVLLSPSEADALARLGPPGSEAALAALWTAKEAVLKAAGVGLRVDPRELTIARDRSAGSAGQTSAEVDAQDAQDTDARAKNADNQTLVDWPHAPFPLSELHLLSLATRPGTAGTVAVVSARRPALRILVPGREARPTR